jgi:hypothetical protein
MKDREGFGDLYKGSYRGISARENIRASEGWLTDKKGVPQSAAPGVECILHLPCSRPNLHTVGSEIVSLSSISTARKHDSQLAG